MKTSIRIYLAAILVLFAVFCMLNSCQRADLDANSTQVEENKKQPKLGEKLQNPYSLSHMQTANNNIKGRGTGETELEATHLYVRFLPENTKKYLYLKDILGLELFSYPLDHAVTEWIDNYHDPAIPEENITWQYTRVPVGCEFPDIKYEILDELYMPFLDDTPTTSSRSVKAEENDAFWNTLIDEAYRVTGNAKEDEAAIKARNGDFDVAVPFFAYTWDDDLNGYIPLKGVKVRLAGFTNWGVTYTDNSGFALFYGKAISTTHYINVEFEGSNWRIFNNNSIAAITPPYQSSINWLKGSSISTKVGPYVNYSNYYSMQIGPNDPALHYATLHRAAYRYFNNNLQITPPYLANYYASLLIRNYGWDYEFAMEEVQHLNNLNIYAGNETGLATSGTIPPELNMDSLIHISINRNSTPNQRHSTSKWFAMATHEIAHIAHRINSEGVQQAYMPDMGLCESWALAVETWLTNSEIRSVTGNNSYQWQNNYQGENRDSYSNPFLRGYTPMLIDLLDDYDQSVQGYGYPIDRVSGYTLSQLETCLFLDKPIYFKNFTSLLKNRYNNPTEQYLDELSDFYNYIPSFENVAGSVWQ